MERECIKNPITFVTAFSKDFSKIKNIVENNLAILKSDPQLDSVSMQGFRCVARRAPTLGQFLAPSAVSCDVQTQLTWLHHKGFFLVEQQDAYVAV